MLQVALKAIAESVEDGKARFSHALVVHPVRFVVTPSQNQTGKSLARYKTL
jgi:hypothetical protein